jgi:tripartite-type tricarboxylate transporter receptor subunit TctC
MIEAKRSMSTIRMSAAVAALTALTTPAAGQSPSLAGKNVQMIIGFATGSVYDLWGRAVARHIGKHLPGNPTIKKSSNS